MHSLKIGFCLDFIISSTSVSTHKRQSRGPADTTWHFPPIFQIAGCFFSLTIVGAALESYLRSAQKKNLHKYWIEFSQTKWGQKLNFLPSDCFAYFWLLPLLYCMSMMMTSYLNNTFAWWCWCAIQEAIVIRVPLGETQPLWEVWVILPVALKHHGVIVQASSFTAYKIKVWRSACISKCFVLVCEDNQSKRMIQDLTVKFGQRFKVILESLSHQLVCK